MNVKSENKKILVSQMKQNGGRITSGEVTALGIHRQYLKQLVESGEIIQTGRGIYQLPDIMEDELFDIQTEYKAGVFSFETALYLFNLLERTPFEWTMTFKGKYHSEKLKERGVRIRLTSADDYGTGIVEANTPGNHKVKVYCPERTLCEILKSRAMTDIQIITFAFREYVKRSEKNLPLLMEMARKFKVEEKVRSYIEVLI